MKDNPKNWKRVLDVKEVKCSDLVSGNDYFIPVTGGTILAKYVGEGTIGYVFVITRPNTIDLCTAYKYLENIYVPF